MKKCKLDDSTHTYTYTHSHTYTYTHIHTHIHTHTYTHIHTHIHTHIYTHTCTQLTRLPTFGLSDKIPNIGVVSNRPTAYDANNIPITIIIHHQCGNTHASSIAHAHA